MVTPVRYYSERTQRVLVKKMLLAENKLEVATGAFCSPTSRLSRDTTAMESSIDTAIKAAGVASCFFN